MTFVSLFEILFGSATQIVVTLFAFLCAAIFCFLFQILFLRKAKEKYGVKMIEKNPALCYISDGAITKQPITMKIYAMI